MAVKKKPPRKKRAVSKTGSKTRAAKKAPAKRATPKKATPGKTAAKTTAAKKTAPAKKGGASRLDPIIVGARENLATALGDMRPAIEGASPYALNWQPAGDGTNSIAVLAVHVMNSTRMWLSVATGAPLPDRDRDSEFFVTTKDAASLLAFVDSFARDCDALLTSAGQVDWTAMRQTHPRPRPGASEMVTGAYALVHALGHLREHVGQMMLTRQLWDAQAKGGG
jgi:uncharacterized damage-inducible protein DinB